MFFLRSKSLILERRLTELWLTPLGRGSWSVKSPRLQTFNPWQRKLLRLVMLFDVYTEGTKARSFPLANQEFRQGPQGHWGSDSIFFSILWCMLPNSPGFRPALQVKWDVSDEEITSFLVPLWGQEQSTVHCNRPWADWVDTSLWGCRAQVINPLSWEQLSCVCRGRTEECREGDPGILGSLSGYQRVVWSGLWVGYG